MEHIHTRKPGSRRPHSTNTRQDRRVVRAAVAVRTEFREEIQAHVVPAVSPRTIGSLLLTAGLRSRVPLARLPFASRHHQARLLCCRERVDWRVAWRSVVFIDESRFSLYASEGLTRVWRRPGEPHLRGDIWCFCRVK